LIAFDEFASPLVGLEVSHVWRGYGSALFLEFGDLTPRGRRRDGTERNPSGQMGLMIEWSWRIERPRSILCGSFSDESKWPGAFKRLLGATVSEVGTFGRLPELAVGLSNGLFVVSFMTAEGQPEWTLIDRRLPDACWLAVRGGRIVSGRDPEVSKRASAKAAQEHKP
jgi:hypothetical protein